MVDRAQISPAQQIGELARVNPVALVAFLQQRVFPRIVPNPIRSHLDGLATIRSSGFPPRNAPNSIRRPCGVFSVPICETPYKPNSGGTSRLAGRTHG